MLQYWKMDIRILGSILGMLGISPGPSPEKLNDSIVYVSKQVVMSKIKEKEAHKIYIYIYIFIYVYIVPTYRKLF